MTIEEKIKLLEDTLETENGALSLDTLLDEVEEYNSMTKLALIVMMEDEFGVMLNSTIIKGFITVEDIVKLMN